MAPVTLVRGNDIRGGFYDSETVDVKFKTPITKIILVGQE